MQDVSSIEQQQRKCREKAAQNQHSIAAEFEFTDAAVSGTKKDRDGLNAMLAAARAGRFAVVYLDSLSRLARELVLTLPMLKELVDVCRVRVISVSEGIDSDHSSWEISAIFRSWMHQEFLKGLREAVLRGQEQSVLNDFSVGDWCIGYGSEPIPGSELGRRGKHPKPRKRVIIVEDHARWVRQIFSWFVEELRSLDWIARELTKQGAPRDHRSKRDRGWHHQVVKNVIRNTKYIGIWPWGRTTTTRNPLTGKVIIEDRSPEEAAKWVRLRPQLRLIEDDQFFLAQARLDEYEAKWDACRSKDGKLRGSTPGSAQQRHMLQRLIKCAVCGSNFQVSGANGKYLCCAGYVRGKCACKTRLPRKLAETLIIQSLRDRIFKQPEWLEAIMQECERAWERDQNKSPGALAAIEKQIESNQQNQRRLVDRIENGSDGLDEVDNRLRQRQSELRLLKQQLARLKAAETVAVEPPTRDWIESELRRLDEIVREQDSVAFGSIKRLVGGRILVTEKSAPGRKRKYLVGTFELSTNTAACTLPGIEMPAPTEVAMRSEEVTIEFRSEAPWAQIADAVKQRFDDGIEFRRIAVEIGCIRSWVPKALAWWHRQRGLPVSDGRQHRKRLKRPKLAEKQADQAKLYWDDGLPMDEIAVRLNSGRDAVTKAIQHWFESRGLPVPDGRNRRKELRLKRQAGAKDLANSDDSPGELTSSGSD